MNRILVRNTEIEIGKPLPWDIYDPQGKRLASANDVISTAERLQDLLSTKACRDSHYESGQEKLDDVSIADCSNSHEQTYPFDAMKLKVGDRLQVQLPARFMVDRVIVRMIGYLNNLSLLITPPREANGLRIQLEEDDELVVRIFTSQNAFGFSSTVAKIIKLPFEFADEAPASPCPVCHGLEFVGLQATDSLLLQGMIYQQMVEQPHAVM